MTERDIFIIALQKEGPAQRLAYLDEACAGQPVLRQQVESLLQLYEGAGSFLEKPAAESAATGAFAGDDEQPSSCESPGTIIGPYKLLQQIGEGGMGTVWMAQQTEPVKRVVALKLIKAGMDSKQVIARFEAERQALALMDHPNIAKVLDAGTTTAGRPYFVMDLVKGVPITRYCDEHHLTPRERLELFIPVCQAVQHAHQKGIIHRDLKPSNVLVALYDGQPVPKVIDFGVAKAAGQALTDKTLVTDFGAIVGTLEYMSPEQAEVNQLDIDTRSDIYSLGVLLYELLAGSPPFSRKDLEKAGMLEMLRVIREQEPSKPSTKLSSSDALPSLSANRGTEPAKLTRLMRGELDWIVMKALEKDRNRRYETANGFALDIQRYLADEAVQACPPSTGYRLRKFARRNKGPVLAASLVMLSLVAGITGTTWGMIRAIVAEAETSREVGEKTEALGQKEAALLTAKANELEAKKQEALARQQETLAAVNAEAAKKQELLAHRHFYAAQINLALHAWEAGEPARVLELLESQRPKFDQEDLRGFEWYYLWRLCHQNLHQLLRGPAGQVVYALAVAPDGKTLASGYADGAVRLWDVATGKERAVLTGHASQIWRLAISPDGKTVASGSMDKTVKLWSLETGELLETLEGRTEMVRSVAFSPDGKGLAVGTEDCGLELWDVATRKRRLTLPALSAPAIALAYSPDGKMIATGQGWNQRNVNGGVKVWDVTEGTPRMIFQKELVMSAAFSPDSTLLATCNRSHARIWSVPSGELKATLISSNPNNFESVAFCADGVSVVLGGYDRTIKIWEFGSGATRAVGTHLAPIQAVAVVPQSDLVASASNDGTVKIWHTRSFQDAGRFAHNSPIRSMTFTPDCKRLIVGSATSTNALDAATGEVAAALPVTGVVAASANLNVLAAKSSDDKWIIWDVAAAEKRAELRLGPTLAGAVFSRDGTTFATWIGSEDVQLWDAAASRLRLSLMLGTMGGSRGAAFSPDGRTIVVTHQFGYVTLWDATTGERRMTLQPKVGSTADGGTVAFSNNGQLVAAANHEGALSVWNVQTGQLHASFKGHAANVVSLAFSPDDKRLLSGSADKTARIWDVATGQELYTLKGHEVMVHLVAFAPDGKRVATASHNVVKLWLAATDADATAIRIELDPDDPDSPRAANLWGDRLADSNQSQEAEAAYRAAQARLEKLSAAFPDVHEYRQELAYNLVTQLISSTDQIQVAEQAQRRLADVYQSLAPDKKQGLGEMLHLRGHALERMGRWQEAIGMFSEALKLAPANRQWQTCQRKAQIELETAERKKQAEQLARQELADAEELTAKFPQVETHWHKLGLVYFQRGQWDEAIDGFGKAIELKPDYWEAWMHRGKAHASLLQWHKVVADQTRAIELKPEAGDAWHYRGFAFFNLGQCDKTIADETKAIELMPKNRWARWRRAQAYSALRQWDQAIVDYTQAIELGATESDVWFSKAAAHASLEQWDQALPDYAKAVAMNPWHLAGAVERFKTANRTEQAEQFERQAVADAEGQTAKLPQVETHWDKLGLVYFQKGQLDKAIHGFSKAIELKPDYWEAWMHRGFAHTSLGQWDEVVVNQTKAIELKPEAGDAWLYRGYAFFNLGQWDKAVADETKAIELLPTNRWARWRRAQAYGALRQWDRAIADYAQALELGATEAEVRLSKAAAHASLEQWDEALAELRQAIAKGFRDAKHLRNRADLAPLREREEFKKQLAELEATNN